MYPMLKYLSFYLLFSLCFSCKDEDDLDLPPLTTEGKMTFGCKIDGKKFLPGGIGGAVISETDGRGWGHISGSNSKTLNYVDIIFNRPGFPLKENIRYECDQEKIHCACVSYDENNECDYRGLPVSGGVVFTKIDSAMRIASGTFEFTVYSSSCDRTAKVTEGRFDVKFSNYR
jgi:hypothetical protein